MMLSVLATGRSLLSVVTRRPTFLSAVVGRCFSDEGGKLAVRKVKKKPKNKSKTETGRPRDLQIILSSLDAKSIKPPPADKEETARRNEVVKNYTIGKFTRHNEENHDLACKLRMQKHALKMMPKNSELKAKALEIEDVGPPRWRNIPAWTPPIPGFDAKKFMNLEE
jgi:hypothetical protein